MTRRWLLGLFFLALAVRAIFVLAEPRTRRVDDEPTWIALGERLASPEVRFSPVLFPHSFHPPLYVYFLGGLRTLGGTLAGVQWAQVVLGAMLAPIVAAIGARAAGRREGVVAGTIAALYPELVWYAAHFFSEILFVTLLWWAFERLLSADRFGEEGGKGAALAAGLLWGLATLTRETALLFVPFVFLWLAFRRPGGLRRAALFTAVAVAVVVPWTVRNWVAFDAFIPVTTRASFNLWIANTSRPWDEVWSEYHALSGGPVQQERHAWREARREILARQPGWILEKVASEMPHFWGVNDMLVVHLQRRAYKRLSVSANRVIAATTVLPYLLVLALAVPGAAAVQPGRVSFLLVGFLVFYLALHVLTLSQTRFRLPVLPVLFLLAAQTATRGVLATWRGLTTGRRALLVALASALALSVSANCLETLRSPVFGLTAEGPSESR